jgi:L-rhamnose mutarotase
VKRIGFLLKVKPEMIPEYKRQHQAVWPEMQAALKRSGWNNYSLFMREDGMLFGYFETPDTFQSALSKMETEEINAKWQSFMAPFFEGLGGARPDETMQELEQVMFLE